jgi:hypothetical protein
MKYQIIADESVDFKIVLQLREVGFITYSIMEEQPSLKDEDVLSIACENDALLTELLNKFSVIDNNKLRIKD